MNVTHRPHGETYIFTSDRGKLILMRALVTCHHPNLGCRGMTGQGKGLCTVHTFLSDSITNQQEIILKACHRNSVIRCSIPRQIWDYHPGGRLTARPKKR